ncbi:diacylglycerol cholinephosphotransferase Mf1 [Mycoplasmopsis adleri]|uniref:diacylglycerol cholinephosphotransferase Mf1 n=1 Tax=Mycoplasmopsis adleri TaxID=51362 RepID=UPI0038730FBC
MIKSTHKFPEELPGLDVNIKKRQEGNLKLLNTIVDILDANNLNYVLAYGTALGFYRDHKMIDWDADIDIIIDLEAYEFLLKNYPEHLMTSDNTPWHYYQFPRWVPSLKDVDVTDPNSLYIDIFVILPSTHRRVSYYNHSLFIKMQCASSWKKVPYFFNKKSANMFYKGLIYTFLFWVPRLTMQRAWKYIIEKKKPNCYYVSNYPNHKNNHKIDIEDFYNPSYVEAYGRKYKLLNNVEKHFLKEYGKTWRTPIKTKHAIYYGFTEMDSK